MVGITNQGNFVFLRNTILKNKNTYKFTPEAILCRCIIIIIIIIIISLALGNQSMAILGDRQSDFFYTIYYRSNPLISIVVAQRIWLAKITVIWVSRLTAPGYIRVVSQDFVKFIFEGQDTLSSNTPDTLRKRVPQITRGPGERVIPSLPRFTSRTESWYFT